MTRGYNKVIIAGNLARDPDLKYTPTGRPRAVFSVAVNKTWKDSEGKLKESVDFLPVVVWGTMADVCKKYLTKGSGVLVEGRLATRSYEKDGIKRYVTEIIAVLVQFLSSPKGSDDQPVGGQGAARSYRDQPSAPQGSEPMILEADDAFPNGSEDVDIPF